MVKRLDNVKKLQIKLMLKSQEKLKTIFFSIHIIFMVTVLPTHQMEVKEVIKLWDYDPMMIVIYHHVQMFKDCITT